MASCGGYVRQAGTEQMADIEWSNQRLHGHITPLDKLLDLRVTSGGLFNVAVLTFLCIL